MTQPGIELQFQTQTKLHKITHIFHIDQIHYPFETLFDLSF